MCQSEGVRVGVYGHEHGYWSLSRKVKIQEEPVATSRITVFISAFTISIY